jgi:hypothetical protein
MAIGKPSPATLNRATELGQRSRVLWIKDLQRREALVRDAGGG